MDLGLHSQQGYDRQLIGSLNRLLHDFCPLIGFAVKTYSKIILLCRQKGNSET